MKLLVTPHELKATFERLFDQYDELFWAVAWASHLSPFFKKLLKSHTKIKKIIVGLHFYQTQPEFIKHFMRSKKVKFIQQTDGTFHPKLYIFKNHSNDWSVLVGSANFSGEAFNNNTEVMCHISSDDKNSSVIYDQAMNVINKLWSEAKEFDTSDFENYFTMWKKTHPKRVKLAGQYGKRPVSKPVFKSSVMMMTWQQFYDMVREEDEHNLEGRLEVVESIREFFQKHRHFHEMGLEMRQAVAGTSENLDAVDYYWFGRMSGSGEFKKQINENNSSLSNALDQIPLDGEITKEHYNDFFDYFKKVFPGETRIGTATRLLAMKRPDVFVCFDSKNRDGLCRDFGIAKSKMTYDRYWDEIIERIRDSVWWNSPEPTSPDQRRVHVARSAFLDAIYYEGESQ